MEDITRYQVKESRRKEMTKRKNEEKTYQVRRIGSGEDIKVEVKAASRGEAIEKADEQHHLPWYVRKTTAKVVK